MLLCRFKVTDLRCSGGFGCSVHSRCRDGFRERVSFATTSVESTFGAGLSHVWANQGDFSSDVSLQDFLVGVLL
jgi:hypothetical protein